MADMPTGTPRQPVLSKSYSQLVGWMASQGLPSWQAGTVWRWILDRRAESFAAMTDLSKSVRTTLERNFVVLGSSIAADQQASDGTRKLLLKLWDHEEVECVLIPDANRRTACISTQVGCGMGCVFCASGLNGVTRNLATGEILEQLVRLRNTLPAHERLTHIVVMGMGEPLANFENLMEALHLATAKNSLGIGARKITISTVGLPKRIRQLADLGKQYHLAVSLHAPDEDMRSQIVPTNEKTGLADILAAADYFHQKTGRQVTFEYVLLRDLNDRADQALALAKLLHGRQAHINLIPFNEVAGLPYRRPTDAALMEFVAILRRAGLSIKVRKRKGSEIDAACGQLRRRLQAERSADVAPPGIVH